MCPKPKNKENKTLPTRWRLKNGAYRYRVPEGLESHWDGKKEFTLGKTLAEAYRTFSERVKINQNIYTINQLCDRYQVEVIPNKAPATQKSNIFFHISIVLIFFCN